MSNGPEWTKVEDDALRAGVAVGTPNHELAQQIGRSKYSVVNRLRDLGVKRSPEVFRAIVRANAQKNRMSPDCWTAEQIAILREMVGRGEAHARISEATGRTVPAVRKRLRKLGLASKVGGGSAREARAKAERQGRVETAKALALKGQTALQISDATGISLTTIWGYLKEAGVRCAKPERPKAEPKPKPEQRAKAINFSKIGRPATSIRRHEAMPIITAAAQFLGRHYPKVYRADLHDNPYIFPKGPPTAYVLGNRVVPVEAMMAEAQALGFGR